MRKFLQLTTFMLMAIGLQSFAATVTWDGGGDGTNWTDPLNWDTDALPTTSDDVVINTAVVLTASTQVQRVLVSGSSGNLTINVGVTLTITGFNGSDDGLEISSSGGSVTNNGTIAISSIDTDDTNADGLYNKGTFVNNGAITITTVGQHGLYLQGGTFTNNAGKTITITNVGGGDTGADYVYMDDNGGTGAIFHNHGELDITMTGVDDGIYIRDGSALTNHSTGEIEIVATGAGDMPVHILGLSGTATASTLTNAGTFTINGTNTTDYGIQVDGANTTPVASIVNSGTFNVQNTPNDAIRIRRGGAFTNSSGGVLNITNPGDEGMQIDVEANTVVNNSGTINITGDNTNTSNHGIQLYSTFNNLAGGVLTVTSCGSDGMRVEASGVFANAGDINMYGSVDNDIELTAGGSFTNSGTATFSPGSKTASSYGVTNIKKDFNLGSATVTFQIGGTTAGTQYDQIENKDNANTITITSATAHLDWGTYVPNVGDEFKIMDESGTVAGPFASVTNSNADIVYTVDYASNTDEVKIVVTDINSTWTGTTDTDWSKSSNWSTIVPTAATDVIIPDLANDPIIGASTGAVAKDITTNGVLTISSGGSLIVSGTPTGNVTYRVAANDTNWHLLSSPVVGATYNGTWITDNDIDDTTGTGTNVAIATYSNGVDADGDWIYATDAANSGTFGTAQGYSIKRDATTNTYIGYTGTLKTDNLTSSITQSVNNWNLKGNPYSSYILVSDLISDNAANLTDTHENVYVWDNNKSGGAGYVALTGTDYLHPGQGFFVNAANSTASNFTIDASKLSHQTGKTLYRGSSNPSIKLNLNDGTKTEYTTINYLEGKTKGLDPSFDVGTFTGSSTAFSIYSHLVSNSNGVDFMRQALPNNDFENMIIPIGVNAIAGKEITFSAEALNLPNGIKVFLEDRLNNTFTRLDETDSNYKVTLNDALNGIGRFYLYATQSSLSVDKSILDNVSIYKLDSSNLRITGLKNGNASIKLFNLLGKEVFNSKFESNGIKDITLPNLAKGIYIAQLQTETGKLNKKIILE